MPFYGIELTLRIRGKSTDSIIENPLHYVPLIAFIDNELRRDCNELYILAIVARKRHDQLLYYPRSTVDVEKFGLHVGISTGPKSYVCGSIERIRPI